MASYQYKTHIIFRISIAYTLRDIVGLRILSIREMVFTLCLILILDPFFSTTTMPLADF